MRRVRSAPANIAMMTHSKKPPPDATVISKEGCNIEGCKDTAINEIISCCASDIDVCDSTEQLAITLFAKFLKDRADDVEIEIVAVCQNILLRLVTTYVTHHFVLATLSLLHDCEKNLHNICDVRMIGHFVHPF